ncbi:MAG: hypothetical protein R2932_53095 [Caldilineaceae bacterium]
MAVAPNGRLYVASWRNRVYSWPNAVTAAGVPDLVFGTGNHSHDAETGCANVAPTNDNFCGPEEYGVDANNNLYVADTYFDRVQIFRNRTPTRRITDRRRHDHR